MKRNATSTVALVVASQIVHFLTYGGIALLLPSSAKTSGSASRRRALCRMRQPESLAPSLQF